ncbi:MAG: hypothetical protein V7642_1214 [Burkholderiales bacterium]|jgi:hypothetical protein
MSPAKIAAFGSETLSEPVQGLKKRAGKSPSPHSHVAPPGKASLNFRASDFQLELLAIPVVLVLVLLREFVVLVVRNLVLQRIA